MEEWKEAWKPVKGNVRYEVSNLGNVRSLCWGGKTYPKRKKPLILKGWINRGYWTVRIGSASRTIHGLMARAFIRNPKRKPTVNHKDGNKLNNLLSNLEWATHGEQMRHAYKLGLVSFSKAERERRRKVMIGNKPTNSCKVFDEATGATYDSLSECAKAFGITRPALAARLHGKVKNNKTPNLRFI